MFKIPPNLKAIGFVIKMRNVPKKFLKFCDKVLYLVVMFKIPPNLKAIGFVIKRRNVPKNS